MVSEVIMEVLSCMCSHPDIDDAGFQTQARTSVSQVFKQGFQIFILVLALEKQPTTKAALKKQP